MIIINNSQIQSNKSNQIRHLLTLSTHLLYDTLCNRPQLGGLLELLLFHRLPHRLCCVAYLSEAVVVEQRLDNTGDFRGSFMQQQSH